MKHIFFLLIVSLSYCSYYSIGDTVIYDHQHEAFNVCYGDYVHDELQLSHLNGKISIFGLSTTWWPTECTFSLEALIDLFGNDDRIQIFESLDDIGQPYSCTEWGDIGQIGIPTIVLPNEQYQLHSWFSLVGYFGEIVILDPNMVFRYFGSNTNDIHNMIEQILSEQSWIIGDINIDQNVNVLDVISLVNIILDGSYSYLSDINQDQTTNIQDIILLLDLIFT